MHRPMVVLCRRSRFPWWLPEVADLDPRTRTVGLLERKVKDHANRPGGADGHAVRDCV